MSRSKCAISRPACASPCFNGAGKRILLTSTGLIFQEHARAILRHLENFLQELTSEPGQMRGSLHVGVVPAFNVALMPRLLGMFAAKHPGISLTVEEISSTEIETAIEEGRMDVGLGFLTRHSPNLRYERLCTDEFALIVSESSVVETADRPVFRTASTPVAAIVRHLRHAPDDRPDLPSTRSARGPSRS